MNNKSNNIVSIVLVFIIVLLLVAGAYMYGKQNAIKSSGEETSQQTTTKESTSVPAQTPEDTDAQVIAAMQNLFATKYHKSAADVIITIREREGNFIVGGVKFAGAPEGGYLLAAKVNGVWTLLFDGNGTIPCSAVDPVNFPSSLQTECWDTTKNITVDRTK